MRYKKWLPYPEPPQEMTPSEQGDLLPDTGQEDIQKPQDPGENLFKYYSCEVLN